MSAHDSHYHRVSDDAPLIEWPGTAEECAVCAPTREPPPSPSVVPVVPTRLAEATQVPVGRGRRASSAK